jgi:hypothetical protein
LDLLKTGIKRRLDRATRDIVEIGGELMQVKVLLPHGSFTSWVESELGMSYRTANRFMNVYHRFGKVDNLADLPHSILYELAAPSTPEPAINAIIDRALAGEKLTVKAARQIVRDYKTESEVAAVELVVETLQGGSLDLTPANVRDANTVISDVARLKAVDLPDGDTVSIDTAAKMVQSGVMQHIHEREQRQQEHIRASQEQRYDSLRFTAELELIQCNTCALILHACDDIPPDWHRGEVEVIIRKRKAA